MKMLQILFVVHAIIVNIATTENIDFKCNHSDDLLYTMPNDHCASYYRCQSHQMIKYECPLGMIFNFHIQKCVSSSNLCFESTCQGKSDGFYADITQACRRFFHCVSGKTVSFNNCRQGFLFNGKICDYAERVNCEATKSSHLAKRNCQDDCKYLPDGVHADESSKDCKSFIKCFNGKSSISRCPSSSVFNPNEQACVPDTLYDCPRSAKLEKLCKGKADGFYIDPRFGCSFYLKCSQGFPTQFDECPKGQYFDFHRKICGYKSSCSHESFSHECKSLEMGYYQNRTLESSCRNFYYCYNGGKTSLNCPHGEIFNGEFCVSDRTYSCPNQESDSCDTKENGYYKDINLDCRSYFYCSSNRKYSFICQDGQAFDGNKCVKRRQSSCAKIQDCVNKPDGYYQDMNSQCTKYYYCKQGDKVQILRCDNGRVYNGYSCVHPSSYACPHIIGYSQALKLNCVQRKCSSTCIRDGFFADYDSRCQNYFFCVSGKQTKLSCNPGYVFNENDGICVPQERYQCPVYCSSECS